ncbi:hypothetical protein XELAEV_18008980mg [Xenopus laevis]|uniref:Uncharacterized protein n=1 Tax=Xenopus laevis TaxID=8355 RepID=A0A974DSR7_XENLA|nr:hypothetical protein XELAEV_18008980mg [Xenopus laevis]
MRNGKYSLHAFAQRCSPEIERRKCINQIIVCSVSHLLARRNTPQHVLLFLVESYMGLQERALCCNNLPSIYNLIISTLMMPP